MMIRLVIILLISEECVDITIFYTEVDRDVMCNHSMLCITVSLCLVLSGYNAVLEPLYFSVHVSVKEKM